MIHAKCNKISLKINVIMLFLTKNITMDAVVDLMKNIMFFLKIQC